MRPIHIPLNYRLTDKPFDSRVAQIVYSLAGMGIVPMAVVALIRHPGSRAEFLLGSGLACLLGLLFVMLGMLCRHVEDGGDKVGLWSRLPEFASYVACVGIMITGTLSLAGLGLTPVQVTLGLLVLCSLSLAVLVLGMMSTVVRLLKG